ncbi:MAG: hypothetical protein GPJ54_14855 [Candidatus Heimdallarchaeota archaeon]|nr:hypothetical protein [Candidatus Heimdallarchaeota archaeon]
MAEALIFAIAIDIFLFVTYIGIFFYLIQVYRRWEETTIGLWGIGTLVVSLSLVFHLVSSLLIENGREELAEIYFSLALSYSFLAIWTFGVSQIIARKKQVDLLGFAVISLILGALITNIWIFNRSILQLTIIQNNFIEKSNSANQSYLFLSILFVLSVSLILARDSYLLYQASKTSYSKSHGKSVALTHLLGWQTWIIGIIVVQLFSEDIGPLKYVIPFILLLVPILTLGSRPFEWTREGFEPVMLLLIDEFGTLVFSWTIDTHSPLTLEGASVASIRKLLENFANESVDSMEIKFKASSLYAKTSNGYLSMLLTTGPHQSFRNILDKIHLILVSSMLKPTEFGLPGYDLPTELKWLLSQLLPTKQDTSEDMSFSLQDTVDAIS